MNRNKRIDLLRGVAALLVIYGHVLQRYDGHDQLFIYNFIQSIQMPLFMAISGYVRIYSKPVCAISSLRAHIKKRILSILLPWLAWSTIAYIFLSKRDIIDHIRYVSFHMEGAFWFLFSLFCIDIIFSVAQFLSAKISKDYSIIRQTIQTLILSGGVY